MSVSVQRRKARTEALRRLFRRGPWENLATACMACNGRKRDRTPDEANMRLRRKPYEPRFIPWLRIKRNTLPSEWGKYLFLWDVSIETNLCEQRGNLRP